MKDHEIAELVNDLRDIAVQFHGAQQLRQRICYAIVDPLKKLQTLERELECEKIESQTLRHGLRLAEQRIKHLLQDNTEQLARLASQEEVYRDALDHAAFYVRDHCQDGEEHAKVIEKLKVPPQYAAKGAA